MTASMSSALTWITGMSKPRARSLAECVERDSCGSVVKPIWLLAMMWIVPPVVYPRRPCMLRVSATTPWPEKAASPWMITGTATIGSRWNSGPRSVWRARVVPSATALTCSRWLGFAASITATALPVRVVYVPSAPRWYFTSPAVLTKSLSSSSTMCDSVWPSNSPRIDSISRPTTCVMNDSRPRWAMPSTTSLVPISASSSTISSVSGTIESMPSIEKVFWPRYCRRKKRSNASTAASRSRMAILRSGSSGVAMSPVSMCLRHQRRCSCEEMCSFS